MFAAKMVCLIADNATRGLDAHQGVVALFDGVTGETLAILNASAITAVRTAAVSALATRALANEGPARLAIIGAGVQARSHLRSIPLVRDVSSAAIVSRTTQSGEALAHDMGPELAFQVDVVPSAEQAVRDADIVVTATTADAPVIDCSCIKAGAHINAVGMRHEIDLATVVAAQLFTDSRESIAAEAPEFRVAIERGSIGPDHVRAELGEVLAGSMPGRRSPSEITLFRGLGIAAEDLVAAQAAVRRAHELGLGTHASL